MKNTPHSRLVRRARIISTCLLAMMVATESSATSFPEVKVSESAFGLIGQTELGVSKIWQEGTESHASLTTWNAQQDDEIEQQVGLGSLVDLGPGNHWRVVEISPTGEQGTGYVKLRLLGD